MSDVQFEEDTSYDVVRPETAKKRKSSTFVDLVIKMKLAKDESEANRVLLVFGVGCIILAVAIYFVSNPPAPSSGPPSISSPVAQ